jgi:Phytanoyl-CoA dioxygenase (PhyH)
MSNLNNISYTVHNYDVAIPKRECLQHINQAEIADLKNDGYIFLPYELNIPDVNKFIYLTDKLLEKKYISEKTSTYATKKFAGQYIRDPHLQEISFLELLTSQYPYVDIVRSLMGPRIVVRSFSLRITHGGSKDGTMWHSDQRSFVTPRPPFFTEPHIFSLSIYLNKADNQSGKLFVCPGTHKISDQPKEKEYFSDLQNQVELEVGSGQAVLFHSALWHKGGENIGKETRRLIIIHFAPVFCRTADYEKVEPSKEYLEYKQKLFEQKDEAMLELLGHIGIKKYSLFM